MPQIAIQGQKGSFHDDVARHYFPESDIVPCDTFHDVFAAMSTEKADIAIVAIENSLYGSIADVYDLLLAHDYKITSEHILHIHQQLIGIAGSQLSEITEVYSHPVALNQCREWLETHLPDAELIEHHDTAGAVAYVKELDSPYAAAIAGERAAELYEMFIIERDIEDEKTNLTRFVILDPSQAIAHPDKASIVLTTKHHSGALYEALGVFAEHNANLTKLQSRPIRGEQFNYQFFIDCDIDAAGLASILSDLQELGCSVILLGHYNHFAFKA
jgi:prephenate dehydratase